MELWVLKMVATAAMVAAAILRLILPHLRLHREAVEKTGCGARSLQRA
jgi:hypothetical protein